MSAVKLEIDWKNTYNRAGSWTPVRILGGSGRKAETLDHARKVVPNANTSRCPYCDSIIYSRRSKLCGVCDQTLPEEMRFDPTEAERIEQLLVRERIRHKRWMERTSGAR